MRTNRARPIDPQRPSGAGYAANLLLSGYIWRGLSVTNKFVIEPDAYVGAYAFTGGFWFNIEPAKDDDSNDITESGRLRSGMVEIDHFQFNDEPGEAAVATEPPK